MTALIYVGIIAVWAAVLVPMWLRRHDHRRSTRGSERLSGRLVARLASRTSVLGIPLPTRGSDPAPAEQARADEGDLAGEAARAHVHGRESARGRRRRARLSASGKRRIWLVLLLSATLVVVSLVVVGMAPWPVALIPAVLLVGFFVLARRQVVIARRNRARAQRRMSARQDAGVQRVASQRAEEPLEPGTWMPRATPLPSYLRTSEDPEQPRAAPAWTAAAMLERAQRERTRAEEERLRAEAEGGRSRTGRDRVREEQRAAVVDDRDEAFLRAQSARWSRGSTEAPFRRASNQ